MRSISASRPMTGSSLPSRASSVRSREYAARVGVPPRKRLPSSSSGEARALALQLFGEQRASGDDTGRGERRADERQRARDRALLGAGRAEPAAAVATGRGRRPAGFAHRGSSRTSTRKRVGGFRVTAPYGSARKTTLTETVTLTLD